MLDNQDVELTSDEPHEWGDDESGVVQSPARLVAWGTLARLLGGITMYATAMGISFAVMPQLTTDLTKGADGKTDPGLASVYDGWLHALYNALSFVANPLLGMYSDGKGRRPVACVTSCGYALSLIIVALLPSVGGLFLGRAVAGVTSAFVTTTSTAMADLAKGTGREAVCFGMIGAGFGMGIVIGPMAGALLYKATESTRIPLAVAAGFMLCQSIYVFFFFPKDPPGHSRRPVQLSCRYARDVSCRFIRNVGQLVSPPLRPITLLYASHNLNLQGIIAVFPYFLLLQFGWGPLERGYLMGAVGISLALSQLAVPYCLNRTLGPVHSLFLLIPADAIHFTLYGLAGTGPRGQANATFLLLPVIFGWLSYPSVSFLRGLIARIVPLEEQGAVQGTLSSVNTLVGVVGSPLASYLFYSFTREDSILPFIPGMSFFCLSTIQIFIFLSVARPLLAMARGSLGKSDSTP